MADNQEFEQSEAEFAIRYSHIMTEIVCLLVSDLQAAGALRPHSKTRILSILSRGYDRNGAHRALDGLKEKLGLDSFQERERKKETPKDLGG